MAVLQFPSSLCGCIEKKKKQGYKTAISDLQNVGFFKKYLKKNSKIWKILNNFEIFQNFPKTGIYVLEPYLVHVH